MTPSPVTLSYVAGPSDEPLLGETIGDNLDRIAAQYPDNTCVVSCHQDLRYSYRQFLEEVNRCARAFLALGVQRGQRVGIWSPNRVEWTITQYATAKLGAILVNINPAYRTSEVEYALTQSGASLLVTAARFKSSDYVGMIAEVRPRIPALETVITLDDDPAGDITWSAFLARAGEVSIDALQRRQASLDFDDPINIQYTSGTTGFPKGATLTHHNILNNAYIVAGIQDIGPGDALCVPVPLYHCFGMVAGNLACTARGATLVYPSEGFDPAATLAAIAAEHCVSVYGVPTMFIAMLDDPGFASYDLSSLRTGIMAGAPCPVEIMKRANHDMHMQEVTIAYGMTETSPVSFQTRRSDDLDHRTSTVGQALPHTEAKIIDPETGAIVPRGATGEFCSRGYLVMRGYWENPEATAAAIDDAGWMHSGDLATMDQDGYVNIVGRIKDMIIRGGENIYPREIEEFLYTHPDIADVQVVGIPDAKFGEELCAWVRLREGAELSLEAMQDFCRGQIAHYKVPRYLRVTTEFPMTVTGKIQKFKMRDITVEELGLQADAAVTTA